MSISSEELLSAPAAHHRRTELDANIDEEAACRLRLQQSQKRHGTYHLQVVIDMHELIKVLERKRLLIEADALRAQAMNILRRLDMLVL